MDRARINEGVRRMRFEALLDRHERGELAQGSAAEMLEISERTFGRWRDRLHDEGPSGLADRRLRPSSRRAAWTEIERMLGLYGAHYGGFTVKHFHEQLVKRRGYRLGYTVTKMHLHRAGLVRPATKRSAFADERARRRRETRMADWLAQADRFLAFNERDVLRNAGSISHDRMEAIVHDRFTTFDANRRAAELAAAEEEAAAEMDELEREAQRLRRPRKPK